MRPGEPVRPRLVLLVTMLGLLMVFASTTSVNVALPAVVAALRPGPGVGDWFLLSYLLANSVLILVFARLSDVLGRRRLYLAGVAVMTLASVGCALAQGAGSLIVWRVLQGVGAAVVLTNSNALVADAFPVARRAAALGLNVMCASVAGAIGPALGGVLVQLFGWQATFLVNVPFGVAAVALGLAVLPRKRSGGVREGFDVGGALLSVAALFLLLFGINRSATWGAADPRVLGCLATAVLCGGLFVLLERRLRHPLVDTGLFGDRRRNCGYLAVIALSVPQTTLPVVLALYEQLVRERSTLASGLAIVPFAVVVAVTAPVAGRLVGRLSAHRLTVAGGVLFSAGLALVATYFALTGPTWLLVVALAVAGLGNGLFHTPNIAALMAGVPANRYGVATGVRSVFFNSSQAVGTAVVLLLLGTWFAAAGAPGLTGPLDDPGAVVPGFVAVGALMVLATLTSSVFSGVARPPRTGTPRLPAPRPAGTSARQSTPQEADAP
ncbi:MFS transporter [Kineococcus sp. SYSU DK003]|uniref:MFS transporter n=1 Tax=Kineococcus sp. SYSU DK003 TaxID=3383124 RepID=UPI003D7C72B2